MSRRSDPVFPSLFDPLLRDLERWRRGPRPGGRIPDALWQAAVRLARDHGVSKTALAVRLDYYKLKERMQASGDPATGSGRRRAPAFLEIPLGVSPQPAPDCVIALENEEKGRLRIELRGRAASEIELLVRSLWSAAK